MSVERDRLAEDFLSFALMAPRALSQAHLLKELEKRVSGWGVTHVAACVMMDHERRFKIGPMFGKPNMAWADVYFGEKLFLDDPVIDYAIRAEKAEYWDEAFDASRIGKPARRVLSIAGDVGARDGYLVPVPLYNGDIMIVSYQGERLERHPDIAGVLRGLAVYFGTEGQRLLIKSRLRSGRFAGLNARQMQVLHLAALGHRNADIAADLGISVKGVEYHLTNIRLQIGARNTKEAIAIIHAAPETLIDPD